MTQPQALHRYDGHLQPTAPFDFTQSTRFLGEFEPTRTEQQVSAGHDQSGHDPRPGHCFQG